MKTLNDLFVELRRWQDVWHRTPMPMDYYEGTAIPLPYDKTTAYLIRWIPGFDPVTNFYINGVGYALIEAFQAGVFNASAFASLKSTIADLMLASEAEDRSVGIGVLKWLQMRGHSVVGVDPHKEPVDRLIDALSEIERQQPPQTGERLSLCDNGKGSCIATLDGTTYPISEPQRDYLRCLLEAKGGWYSPEKGSSVRPDRLRRKLPASLQSLIEAKSRLGTRLIV